MIGTPLAGRVTRAVRSALLSHGWEGASCDAASAALEPWAHHCTGLTPEQVEGLLRHAPKFGIDLLTGENWAILIGTRSRLSAFARSWTLPPELAEVAIGLGSGLPADPPTYWRAGRQVIELSQPVLLDRLPADVRMVAAGNPKPGTGSWEGDTGILLVADDSASVLEQFAQALDAMLTAGVDPERIALDPRWTPGAPPLDLYLCFGRPLICTTDDPVVAALARLDGAQVFLTSRVDAVGRALAMADSRAESREPGAET